ncbi:ribose-phosphate pyrophosphokinase [Mycoplasma phocimorsus]|uniref:ribose-phosphate diphosphokinase n=1 Tax=Mycoplasma phocimorsus TaxID=3045839 RepID=A0AAJ1UWF9_9MOLU|nr:ribose-phosphate pyrophosphokinase [Mycoplasma phocimorsus]MDJ1645582.1 ribose-phosphate pyrophosphokinase [Mycoplasma phocimorsus]MDJ1646150.1 ribose-phosphate pyrophosphokinase [Mycoplasma phocimorsus]MDJ1647176.1 ribose-phosphate pyrophosphokinase [Mycoplasma phocimorsus]MDJ1647699.1 ribose-phosphate pyrophosphokinase [Mycoplasma phocimorsus]MDJ1648303.1 ribose-phosphate pyrophosphokinase [Mycoplasma phocimorsus]
MENKFLLFALDNSKELGEKIAKRLNVDLSEINKTVFADGEIMLVSEVSVRNKDVFVIANTSKPVNNNIIEILLFIDSLKRASAKSIHIVLTYYGYSRQDRKAKGRQPIGASLIAKLLQTAGANRMTCVDLHNPAIQGFFDIPVDDLRAQYIFAKELVKSNEHVSVISPDHGGTVRARLLAELIADNIEIAIIDKRRVGPNKSEVMGMIGKVNSDVAVIVDDMIDTGGTIIKAAQVAKENGAKKVYLAASHGIFSRGFDALQNSEYVDKVFITDSIDNSENEKKFSKLKVISLTNFIADTIDAYNNGKSVSDIYKAIRDEVDELREKN